LNGGLTCLNLPAVIIGAVVGDGEFEMAHEAKVADTRRPASPALLAAF
jgi:hypothetical protein